MKISIASLGEEPAERFPGYVRLCEELGFASFCHNDGRWPRDVYVRLATAAATTTRIGLGITVTDPFVRHPAITAQATATLAETSGGRLRVMLGAGSHFETLPGFDVVRPAVAIRETAEVLRRMWRGEKVVYDGEIVRVAGAQLGFPPDERAIPSLWVAGRGPGVLRTAGAVADGVLVGSLATPTGIAWARARVDEGMAAAGRVEPPALASWLYVAILDREDDPVPDAIRRGVSYALWSSRQVADQLLADVDLGDAAAFTGFMRDAPHEWTPEIMAELRRLIPRSVVDALSVVGTPGQVVERLRALERAGIGEAIVWPFPAPGQAVEAFATQLATEVMAEVA